MSQPGSNVASPSRLALWCRRLLALTSWTYLATILVVWIVLGYAETWWPATLLMFAPRCVFALPLAVLIPGSFFAGWRTVIVTLAATMLVAGPVIGVNVPWRRLTDAQAPGAPLRVMTCNMHDASVDPAMLDNLIITTNPDFVAVQEWYRAGKSTLSRMESWHVRRSEHHFFASRHPIRKDVALNHNWAKGGGSAMLYEVETPLGIVTVFSLHFATTREGIYNILHQNKQGPAEVQANSDERRAQSEFVAQEAAKCSGPVLIMGDFNTPPESPFFRQIWNPYTDAFTTAGWGPGYTFLGSKTTVRIDHILAGPGWDCTKCWIGPDVGSPHRPVIADVVWLGARPGEGE